MNEQENKIHRIFKWVLVAKGLFAFFEVVGGILVLFISKEFIANTVFWFTQDELAADPTDYLAHQLVQWSQLISVSTQHFASFFLVSHGIIKLFLVIGLLKKKLWFYPLSISAFILFILNQLVRYSHTHSVVLLAVTVLDIAIVWLTWKDYNLLKAENNFKK